MGSTYFDTLVRRRTAQSELNATSSHRSRADRISQKSYRRVWLLGPVVPQRSLGPVPSGELAQDSADVMLDSAEGDPERDRDLSVGKPVSDQPEHLRFAATQPAESTIGFQWVAPSQVLRQAQGPEVTRQVAEATGVRDLGRHAGTLNAWAQLNPDAEGNPDYWKDYKAFALALMHEPHQPPAPQKP